MTYSGKLYGLHAGQYLPMRLTAADVDQLERDLATTKAELALALKKLEPLGADAITPPTPADASLFGQAP
jgi:hypothetical protein